MGRYLFIFFVSFVAISTIASSTAHATITEGNKTLLAEALLKYQSGKYSDTLTTLEKIHGDRETQGVVAYWRGLCEFQKKEYDAAVIHLKRAKSLNNNADDLDYTLGQAYFASQKLPEATHAFIDSAKRGYKQGASLYYLGYIQQILDRDAKADKIYKYVGKLRNDPDGVKQAALFQRAEIRFGRAQAIKDEQKRAKALEARVLPAYEAALDYDDDSSTAQEAKAKVAEVRSIIQKAEPPRFFTHRATIETVYDTNVITRADDAVTSISSKDSLIFKPTLRSTFNRPIGKVFAISGGMRTALKYHARRTIPDVYKNDNITLEPNIALDWDHTYGDKKATTTLNLEFNYQLQDWVKAHEFPYYSRSWNIEATERADIWKTGETSFKANMKAYENYSTASNSLQPSVELGQRFDMGAGKLSTKLGIDWLNSRTATDSTVTYKITNRLPIDLSDTWNITPKFTFSFIDPPQARATRGLEKKWNPGISFRKTYPNGMILRFGYDYTRNQSKDTVNQQYTRHEVTLATEFRF
jgi:tetratricopeptide (TPR) repeat protein